MDKKLIEAAGICEAMTHAKKLYFSSLKPSDIPEGIAGVYAIFNANTGETLYVGRTKNLRQRRPTGAGGAA